MFQASNIELDFFAYTPYSMNFPSTPGSSVHESTCVGVSFLIKLQASSLQLY